MTALGVVQLLVYLGVLLAVAKPLGIYMARVYEGRLGGIGRVLGPVERFLYRIAGVKADEEMGWRRYALAMLLFNFVGFLLLYALQRLQGGLPANPAHLPAVGPDLSFNTAVSFVTNTNWQSYSGEQTMSYLTQMFGLAVQNFLSAASGMAVLVALIRGIARRTASTIGNFWVDTVRGTLYILLPLSLLLALALVSQGVVQTFAPYKKAALVQPVVVDQPKLDASGTPVKDAQGNPVTEKVTVTGQTLALGPAASQIAIKQLGTNGGGFYNVNSAHPFENPTPLSNFLEVLAILLISGALCLTFGEMVRDRRQGWAILAAMVVILVGFAILAISSEQAGNPLLARLGVDQRPSALQPGGNMEGKEVRFGPIASGLWATATTAASNGSVNSMHDSFTPLGGLVPMALMQIGEVVFGGVGSGLYGMLAFVIVAVFIAGSDGGPDAGVHRQEDPIVRDEDGVARDPDPSGVRAFRHGDCCGNGCGARRCVQPGRARLLPDPIRVLVGEQQQRLSVRGPECKHAVLQLRARARDVLRSFLDEDPDPGDRRLAGCKESHAGRRRNPRDPHTAFRRIAHRHGSARRRAYVLAGVGARPDRRAPSDARGGAVRRKAMPSRVQALNLFEPAIVRRAILDSFRKLDPRHMVRNPVMFVTEVVSVLTTVLFVQALFGHGEAPAGFILAVSVWLWFTVLFANFAEAMAEGRGKAQADALRRARKELVAKFLGQPHHGAGWAPVPARMLHTGDAVLVETGDIIPCDGEVIEGIASVDESVITGESAPVIRESGGDRSAVTAGTRVLSDWLVVRVGAEEGETFLDRMIAMVEGAKRQRTPNEIALSILLAALTIVFLLAVATLLPFSLYSVQVAGQGQPVTVTVLVALLVCLIPTTIGGLLSAIGIAGMDRMIQANVIATSGRAVEAAGDVDVLLLDKTGTITLGNRQATGFIPAPGISPEELADAAQLASLADETPEGRSIVVLAKEKHGLRGRDVHRLGATFVPFTAQTRMSGVNLDGRAIRKGAADAVAAFVADHGGRVPDEVSASVEGIARAGGTPLVVADGARVLGVIQLKDIVKGGIRERFAELRRMGIRTVMITGDNQLTAAAIAAEAGVDDFLAEATPETKLRLIRELQGGGRLVAMTGDGTNDAPALAQADVAVAMNSGTQAAKEAGNMVDLDSNPTKLLEVVEIGKQLLMTRGSLTTFSIANDVAKYFAIIPAMFVATYPQLGALNVMGLATPASAVMSAVIFNALIIIALIPLALRGVAYRPIGAAALLRRNLLLYGLGGLVAPFVGIKAIDLLLEVLHLV